MPNIYLSPSTQEGNFFVGGGTEEFYSNLLADALEPYLISSGIRFTRNTPDMTAASSIKASNAGNYDLHLALHSNAAPPDLAGKLQGSQMYYNPEVYQSQVMAEILQSNFKNIYPNPEKVVTVPTSTLGEVVKVKAPGVLIEVAFHDNIEDANWIKNNIQAIARAIALSLTEFFDIPLIPPQPIRMGTVHVRWGYLNVREKPSLTAPVIGKLYQGQRVEILGQWQDWYVVRRGDLVGYASRSFITPMG
jgi:N-acetylmuramoyl-L-alanine amidase